MLTIYELNDEIKKQENCEAILNLIDKYVEEVKRKDYKNLILLKYYKCLLDINNFSKISEIEKWIISNKKNFKNKNDILSNLILKLLKLNEMDLIQLDKKSQLEDIIKNDFVFYHWKMSKIFKNITMEIKNENSLNVLLFFKNQIEEYFFKNFEKFIVFLPNEDLKIYKKNIILLYNKINEKIPDEYLELLQYIDD